MGYEFSVLIWNLYLSIQNPGDAWCGQSQNHHRGLPDVNHVLINRHHVLIGRIQLAAFVQEAHVKFVTYKENR